MYSLSAYYALNTVVETKTEYPLEWNQNYNKTSQKEVLENYGNFFFFFASCLDVLEKTPWRTWREGKAA